MDPFIRDTLKLCLEIITNVSGCIFTYPICWFKSSVERLSKDNSELYSKLPDIYFVLTLDWLPSKGKLYLILPINKKTYIPLCIVLGYLGHIHFSKSSPFNLTDIILVRQSEMLLYPFTNPTFQMTDVDASLIAWYHIPK